MQTRIPYETPLTREARLAREADDARKLRDAIATRRINIIKWQRHDLHVADLNPNFSARFRDHRKPPSREKSTAVLKAKKEANLKRVLDYLARYTEPVRCKDLAIDLELIERVARTYLSELCHRGHAVAVYGAPAKPGHKERLIGYLATSTTIAQPSLSDGSTTANALP